MTRVLVTGHLGYIGAIMTPRLTAAGYDVVGLDTHLYRGCDFPGCEAAGPVTTIDRDVRDVTAADLEGIDAVFHLAALSNDPLGDLDPTLTDQINHVATVNLARRARDAGVSRFIFSSSCSNYGASSGDDMLDEHAALNPVTPYGVSKVQSEQTLATLATDDFSPTMLRNATAYGMSPRLRVDLVVNNLVAWAVTTGQVLLKSDGTAWRPLVHIADICRAFETVLEAPQEKIHNAVFNVGGTDENYLIRDVAEIVADVVPDCHLQFAEGASADKRNYRVNCDHIAETLGFSLEWTVRRGVEEAYEAYTRIDLQQEHLEGPAFQRIARIKEQLADGSLGPDLRPSMASAS